MSFMQRTYVVAAMHRIARDWAHANEYDMSNVVTFTKPSSLRALAKQTPIIVIDSSIKFDDSRAMEEVLTRFTDVKRITG